ncbi:MAG: amidohydrolase [Ottowia sp.]|nr:amidohydrolase [Ottowia sp.]
MKHSHTHTPSCACCTLPLLALVGNNEQDQQHWAAEIQTVLKEKTAAKTISNAQASNPSAFIFHNGTIYTMQNGQPNRVAALSVVDSKVKAAGTLEQVKAAMKNGPQATQIDLQGRTLLPGFIEPHMHVLPSALFLAWVQLGPFVGQRLRPGYNKAWIAQQLKQALTQLPATAKMPGAKQPWLLGAGVDPSLMEVWQDPDQTFLDSISGSIPIFLMNSSGHIGYANTAAMQIAGVHTDKGILTEEQISKILPFLPKPSPLSFLKNFQAVMNNATSLGITSLFDAGLGAALGVIEVDLLRVLAHSPFTPVRMAAALFSNEDAQLEKWLDLYKPTGNIGDDERFSIKALKLVSDGSNQGLTGYQREDYCCAKEHPLPGVSPRGLFNFEPPLTFTQCLQKVIDHGWPVLVHANGDQAVNYVLAAYEIAISNQSNQNMLRHRLEHASLLDDTSIATMARLGISPSFLIGHVGYWGYVLQQTILGPERTNTLDRCYTAQQTGLRISLHSDHFVSPLGPLRLMEQAVTRVMEAAPPGKNAVLNPAECLERVDALRAITYDAAWQCHLDHLVGSLEPGKLADMVILEQDPLDPEITALRDIAVHETWLAGKRVYSHPQTALPKLATELDTDNVF